MELTLLASLSSSTLSFSFLLLVQALALNRTRNTAPALIVFGDSIVDPGNNNGMNTMIKCNFPPYGQDFIDHKPTGRFSNGRVPSDMIASQMGIKELVPAYLGTNLTPEDLLTGVSFASGANGYDPLTSKLMSVLSLPEQLDLFKEYIGKIKAIVGEERASSIIAKSQYMVSTGSDDLANTYFPTPLRRVQYDVPSYVNLMVHYASDFLKDLYALGARKIGIISLPPIGCVPSQRTIQGGILRDCSQPLNEAAMLFNSQISNELQTLNETLPGVKMILIDIYNPLLHMMQNAPSYGFEVYTNGCCGTGTFEVTMLCNSVTTTTCEDVSKYLFWDSYHPTERAYEVLLNLTLPNYMNALS
ncbi:GDSL esterase/lipase EXL3 [Acorus calamus]|uniref:GDSL esterase/lipase EXL3 n=1 Tax=Acorus calamus TaxID=4465 RepID=A0AAV9FJC4_ACOCL|nr:GDSL esterase/lipase EXL3 [Acorus calamus]